MNNIATLCIAILIVFYGALSCNVSRVRRNRRTDLTITEATLTKAVRAHGNAAEYIPLLVAGLLYLSSTSPGILLDALAVAVLISRLLHAAGTLLAATIDDPHPLKFMGGLGTYFCLFALGGALLTQWVRNSA